ncbi:S8 family peptidase [Legionella gresilensis]|uniref:S8 family peptidase n=1 Tax=Legionella gresilensis TaxID=91823 RepID=UPI0010410B88|nr:S8 family peptidase [Legionella gresilensis]
MVKKLIILSLYLVIVTVNAKPFIDKEVLRAIQAVHLEQQGIYQSLLIFFKSDSKKKFFVKVMEKDPSLLLTPLDFMPVVVVTFLPTDKTYKKMTSFPGVLYIALNKPAAEKVEISPHSIKPKVPFRYPGIDLWWEHGFIGHKGVLGLIDSGIAYDHPAFLTKKIIINKTPASHYIDYPFGVRTAHGTGVACIYAGLPLENTQYLRGVAYETPVILSTLAGEGTAHMHNFGLTYSSLNWLLSSPYRPTIINYSFGNGNVTCPSCPDWSGLSKVVDYIINQKKILWVTSAGNNSYIKQKKKPPFVSTMTVPAESYNALTVANMNMYSNSDATNRKFDRQSHAIYYTSSRGPTLIGRKKPDIAAPGNDTWTCAPSPKKYQLNYLKSMHYKNGYRYMGGTSSAAPHVGGAVLLLNDAGITSPIAIKALLINSADTWTDSNKPGPDDPNFPYKGGHRQIIGSEWNPTYGWGYMNLQTAFYQRNFIIEDNLSPKKPAREYRIKMRYQDKVTLVHERRVGFNKKGRLWRLSHLILEILDASNGKLLAKDDSSIDNVHQVSLCNALNLSRCFKIAPREVIVRVSLKSSSIDGSSIEPFALALPTNINKVRI